MSRVDAALSTFQTGLLRVEREMLPIYSLTDKLRATQRNIDLCVFELRGVRENFVAAQEVRLIEECGVGCGFASNVLVVPGTHSAT